MTAKVIESKPTVLLLFDRRHSGTARLLKDAGHHVLTSYLPDLAVATCVNNRVDVVIVDQQHFVEKEGWSVAKSIKMVRTSICVVLVVEQKEAAEEPPESVDALIAERDHRGLLRTIGKMLESDSVPSRTNKR